MLALGELETCTWDNQICTLSRPGATRWSCHYSSVNRLIDMFGATCTVLENTMKNGLSNNIMGEAKGVLQALRSFEFVFILQLMNEVMGITHMLCHASSVIEISKHLKCITFSKKYKNTYSRIKAEGLG
ncbi:hypothetical protein ACOSQ2_017461 [Xanthoceras sorbifolium]